MPSYIRMTTFLARETQTIYVCTFDYRSKSCDDIATHTATLEKPTDNVGSRDFISTS